MIAVALWRVVGRGFFCLSMYGGLCLVSCVGQSGENDVRWARSAAVKRLVIGIWQFSRRVPIQNDYIAESVR